MFSVLGVQHAVQPISGGCGAFSTTSFRHAQDPQRQGDDTFPSKTGELKGFHGGEFKRASYRAPSSNHQNRTVPFLAFPPSRFPNEGEPLMIATPAGETNAHHTKPLLLYVAKRKKTERSLVFFI